MKDRYPQFTKDRLIEIATQALHSLIETDEEKAEVLIDELDLSLEEMNFFDVDDIETEDFDDEN